MCTYFLLRPLKMGKKFVFGRALILIFSFFFFLFSTQKLVQQKIIGLDQVIYHIKAFSVAIRTTQKIQKNFSRCHLLRNETQKRKFEFENFVFILCRVFKLLFRFSHQAKNKRRRNSKKKFSSVKQNCQNNLC